MKKAKFATRQSMFFIWSGILMVGALLAVLKDFNPPWKKFQQDFEKVTVQLAQEEIDRENAKIETIYNNRIEEIDRRIRELSDATRALNHQKTIEAKEAEIRELTEKEYQTGQALSFAKSELGAWRSKYEFLRNDMFATKDEINAAKEKYDHFFMEVQELTPAADQAYAELTKAKDELKELQKGPADLVREKEAIYAELKTWREEVQKIRPNDIVAFTARQARDIPLLDFLGPKYNLKQVVMDDFPDLTHSGKVDRCQTCHLGATDARYDREDIPSVFRAHPNLELFVGKDSPHPVEKFGCTSCHLGRGYGTTFTLAAHTPNDHEQEEEWKKEYGWKELHYWDYPMLPKENRQAMCFSCHKTNGGYELTAARDIYEGRLIYERRGCHGCHKIEGVSNDMKKVGPTLMHIADKLDKDWTPRWVHAPREFYEKARMPHPFGHRIPTEENFPEYLHHLEESMDAAHFKQVEEEFEHLREEMVRDEAVMVEAAVAYLYDKSTSVEMEEPPAEEGDPEQGKQIVAVNNCMACHVLDEVQPNRSGPTPEGILQYGPDISKIGSKTNRKWLYNWLLNPKKYWPDGNMPDPRLTPEEANHVTAYLLTLKDDTYMEQPLPEVTSDALDEITVRFMRSKLPESEAVARAAKMSDHEKKLYVGEETIYRNGCFGCHDISGFEDRQRIGAELTATAFKEIELFDFGMHKYVHIPHQRHKWIDQKVRQPYVYFLGKVLNPYEQELRMPWFGFNEKEAAQITTFIMGQTGKTPPAKYVYDPQGPKRDILEGMKLIERKNCAGCHKVGAGEQFVTVGNFDFDSDKVWTREALIAVHDPNLPENHFTKIAQSKEPTENDKVIIPKDAWVTGETIFGEDQYLSVTGDLLAEEAPTVDVGAADEIEVPLERPEKLGVYGVGEGHVMKYYEQDALAPPVLREEGAKVRPEWFFNFLKNIHTIRTHIQVRMPQWEWTDEEATKIVKYFAAAAEEQFPYKTEDIAPLSDAHRETAKKIFGLPGTEEYSNSLQCFSCHPAGDLKPTSPSDNWGPDLYMAQDRLKFDFLKSWLTHPPSWAPGTRMPGYFYETDGGVLKQAPPATPFVGEIGTDEAIKRLAEMLYHLPDIQEVADAAKAAAEQQKLAPPPAPPEEEPFEEPFEEEAEEGDFAN